jgi:hypothetical protein
MIFPAMRTSTTRHRPVFSDPSGLNWLRLRLTGPKLSSSTRAPPVTDTSITNLQELDPELYRMLYAGRAHHGRGSNCGPCAAIGNGGRGPLGHGQDGAGECAAVESNWTNTQSDLDADIHPGQSHAQRNAFVADETNRSRFDATASIQRTVRQADSANGLASYPATTVAHEEKADGESVSPTAGISDRTSHYDAEGGKDLSQSLTPASNASATKSNRVAKNDSTMARNRNPASPSGHSNDRIGKLADGDNVKQYEETLVPDRHLDLLRRTPRLASRLNPSHNKSAPQLSVPAPPVQHSQASTAQPTPQADEGQMRAHAKRMLLAGDTVGQIFQTLGISEQTFNRWQAEQTASRSTHGRRMRELEVENTRLRQLISQLMLEKTAPGLPPEALLKILRANRVSV